MRLAACREPRARGGSRAEELPVRGRRRRAAHDDQVGRRRRGAGRRAARAHPGQRDAHDADRQWARRAAAALALGQAALRRPLVRRDPRLLVAARGRQVPRDPCGALRTCLPAVRGARRDAPLHGLGGRPALHGRAARRCARRGAPTAAPPLTRLWSAPRCSSRGAPPGLLLGWGQAPCALPPLTPAERAALVWARQRARCSASARGARRRTRGRSWTRCSSRRWSCSSASRGRRSSSRRSRSSRCRPSTRRTSRSSTTSTRSKRTRRRRRRRSRAPTSGSRASSAPRRRRSARRPRRCRRWRWRTCAPPRSSRTCTSASSRPRRRASRRCARRRRTCSASSRSGSSCCTSR